jgi:hypothetical protein
VKAATSKNPSASLEVAVATALTLWMVVLHLMFLTHAGPLWRDEAEAIGFASMPSLAGTFQSLHYGNFPPLFATVARCWTLAGLGTDTGYRVLGCLMGLGTLGALWFGARALGARAPLLALALFAANPAALRIGDSMRSYGLGIILLVLTQALIWKYVQRPRRSSWAAAAAAAILGVQCLYQSSWFILAFCAGAWTVTLAQKQWRTAAGVGLIGAAAALSLLPDLGNLLRSREWFDITQASVSFDWILDALLETCRAGGAWMALVWSALFGMAVAASLFIAWPLRAWNMIYAGVGLVAGTALFLGFLLYASCAPQPWHFPIFLAPSALAIEAVLAGIPLAAVQWARPALAVLAVLMSIPLCRAGVMLRQSNVDLVALKLKASAQPGDLILVSPWYVGLSMRRYLDEKRWTSVPPIADYRFHRYDLLKERMVSAHPIAGLEEQIRQVLRDGHALWVAGMFRFQSPGSGPPQVYPLYRGGIQLADAKYCDSWVSQITEMIRTNGCDITPVPVPVPAHAPVNPIEDISLRVIRGWHGK